MFKQIAKMVLGSATGMSGPEGFVVDTIANLAFSGKTPKSSKKLHTRASTPAIPGQVSRVPNLSTPVRGAGLPVDDRPSNVSLRNLQSIHLATMAQFGKTPNIGLGVAQTQLRLK